MRIGNIELEWLGQSGFLIKNGKNIYIDPFKIHNTEKADIVLITHSHYDHCSLEDLQKILKDGSIIVMPADVQSKITKLNFKVAMQIMEPGDSIDLNGLKIDAIPAYNIKKPYHSKLEGWLGYVLKFDNAIIYHAGDTDLIPEMEKLTGYSKKGNEFVALLPVGGEYTMNADEAALAAKKIKATITIPMHFGSIIGDKNDADKFCQLADSVSCKILDKK
jgi:L-ascorbate metabolism protein UlaG (beta-lactamase superfamily)